MDIAALTSMIAPSYSMNSSIIGDLNGENAGPLPFEVLQGYTNASTSLTSPTSVNQSVVSNLVKTTSSDLPFSVLNPVSSYGNLSSTLKALQNYSTPGEIVNMLA